MLPSLVAAARPQSVRRPLHSSDGEHFPAYRSYIGRSVSHPLCLLVSYIASSVQLQGGQKVLDIRLHPKGAPYLVAGCNIVRSYSYPFASDSNCQTDSGVVL